MSGNGNLAGELAWHGAFSEWNGMESEVSRSVCGVESELSCLVIAKKRGGRKRKIEKEKDFMN